MERSPVYSSNIVSIGYDSGTMTLEVEFKNDSIYQYYDVPEALYLELLHADSVGKFLNAEIKNSYRYVRL